MEQYSFNASSLSNRLSIPILLLSSAKLSRFRKSSIRCVFLKPNRSARVPEYRQCMYSTGGYGFRGHVVGSMTAVQYIRSVERGDRWRGYRLRTRVVDTIANHGDTAQMTAAAAGRQVIDEVLQRAVHDRQPSVLSTSRFTAAACATVDADSNEDLQSN